MVHRQLGLWPMKSEVKQQVSKTFLIDVKSSSAKGAPQKLIKV